MSSHVTQKTAYVAAAAEALLTTPLFSRDEEIIDQNPRQEEGSKPEETVAIRGDLDYLHPDGVQLRPELRHVGLLPQLLDLQRNRRN